MLILATDSNSFLAGPLLLQPPLATEDLARGGSNLALASAHLGASLGVGGAVAHDVSSALDLGSSGMDTCTAGAAVNVAVATVCLKQNSLLVKIALETVCNKF